MLIQSTDAASKPLLIKRRGLFADRPDRKQAILSAAEQLFAKYGYHAVSIRQIAQQAEVPLALVGYYFGAKHELFYAIFEQWENTAQQRLAQLQQARQVPLEDRLEAIIEAFILPVLEVRARAEGEHYALLVARELMYNSAEADRVMRQFFNPIAQEFIAALQEALPNTHRDDIAWVYQFSVGSLLHHLCDTRTARLFEGHTPINSPRIQRLLVQFIVGGIRAAIAAR